MMAIRGWVLLLSLLLIAALHLTKADLPAIFIFGDSTVDVGTNNFLNCSLAKADHLFYGIDFSPPKPTGRFSNGYNTADFIAKLLGYKKSPPSFLSLSQYQQSKFDKQFLNGVNFASGGSGILNDTGKNAFKEVVSLGEQIQQFASVREDMTKILGSNVTNNLLSKALYLISAGSNDLFDYQRSLHSNATNATTIAPPMLIFNLSAAYFNHFKDLYNLGAKKFGIVSIPPIGCCPAERYLNSVFNGSDGCFEEMNQLAQAFYTSIQALLGDFSSQFQGVKYSLGNSYNMTMAVINNSYALGFTNIEEACCGTGAFNGESECNITATLCPDRTKHLFWDWFHPTQSVSKLAAQTLYYGPTDYVTPMNLSQLVLPNI